MLHVATYLAPSSIQGLGLFTPAPLAAGTVIWEFRPEVDWRFTPEEMESFPAPFRGQLRRWCYREEGTGFYVLCGDNAKFMNHSPTPNCDDSGPFTVTGREIEVGEELTCDYRSFDAEAAERGLEFGAEPALASSGA